jgi:hypothetical protein
MVPSEMFRYMKQMSDTLVAMLVTKSRTVAPVSSSGQYHVSLGQYRNRHSSIPVMAIVESGLYLKVDKDVQAGN